MQMRALHTLEPGPSHAAHIDHNIRLADPYLSEEGFVREPEVIFSRYVTICHFSDALWRIYSQQKFPELI